MATLEAVPGMLNFVTSSIVMERKSHKEVSDELRGLLPQMSRLSERSIRRFCARNDIHTTSRLTASQINAVVSSSVSQVINLVIKVTV